MSDATDKGEKKLTLSGRKTLQLKTSVEPGQVRQSLSHGRGNQLLLNASDAGSFLLIQKNLLLKKRLRKAQ